MRNPHLLLDQSVQLPSAAETELDAHATGTDPGSAPANCLM